MTRRSTSTGTIDTYVSVDVYHICAYILYGCTKNIHVYIQIYIYLFVYYIYVSVCVYIYIHNIYIYIHTRNLCRLPGLMHKALTPFLLHPVQRHRQRGTRSGGVEGKIVEGGGSCRISISYKQFSIKSNSDSSQIAIAIGVLTSNRGEDDEPLWRIGRGTRVPLQGAVDVVPLLGAIVRCHCSVLWLRGRVTTNFGGADGVPLLGAIAGCHCSVLDG